MPAAKTKHPNMQAALVAAARDVTSPDKDGTNQHQRYKYVTAENMIATTKAPLADHGLTVSMGSVTLGERFEGATMKRGEISGAGWVVGVEMRLEWEGGETRADTVQFPAILEGGRPFDKAVNAALTNVANYWLRGLLNIPRGLGPGVDEREDRDDGQPPQHSQRGGYDRPDHNSHDAKVTALRRLLSGSYGAKTPEEADALVRMVAGMSLDEAKTIPPATEKALAALRDWTHPEFTKANAVAEALRLRAADAAEDEDSAA